MMVIAVAALNEYGRIGSVFGVDFTANVDQMDTFADVSSCLFDCAVTVDVAELTKAETASVVARVGKSIDGHFVRVALKYLTDSTIEFVVSDRCPVWRFLIAYGCSLAHLGVHWSI